MNKKIFLFFLFTLTVFSFERQRIAIFQVEGVGVKDEIKTALLMSLSSELTNSKRIINIERSEIDKILKEQAIQLSGCTSIECQVEVGRMLGAEKVIFGTISKVEEQFLISAKIVDVTLGTIEFEIGPIKCKSVDEFKRIAQEIVKGIEEKIPVIPEIVGFLGNQPVLDVGRNLGIQVGDVFTVLRIKDVVKNKEGRVIFRNEEVIGKIKVISIQEDGAVCEIIEKTKDIVKGDISRKGDISGIKTGDIEGPIINHTPIKFAKSNKPLIIKAKVNDKTGVKDVVIKIKTEDGKTFKYEMNREDKETYSLSVPKDKLKLYRLYYEIEANDVNGNRSILNDNGNPFEVTIEQVKGSKKTLYIIIGSAVAAGVGGGATYFILRSTGVELPGLPQRP